MISKLNGKTPIIAPDAFVAPGAVVMGNVEIGPRASIWYGCVLRGDINWIKVGARSNIQDGTICHVAHRGNGVLVGDDVVVGHRVILHSCIIEDRVLVGMGSVLMDRVRVGTGALIAAGSVVPPGMEIPPGMMVSGVPAKVRRPVTEGEQALTMAIIDRYLRVASCHADTELVIDFSQDPI